MIRKLMLIIVMLLLISLAGCREEEEMKRVLLYSPVESPAAQLFKNTIIALGYTEGEDIEFIIDDAGGDPKNIPLMLKDFMDQDLDLIITSGAEIVKELWKISENVPVFGVTSDPVGEGLVPSMRDHGKNFACVATLVPTELQVDYIRRILPEAEKVLIPYNPSFSYEVDHLRSAEKAAQLRDLKVDARPAYNDEELQVIVDDFPADIDAVLIPSVRIATTAFDDEKLIPFCLDKGIPLFVSSDRSVKSGALMSYNYSLQKYFEQSAILIDKVLKGEAPENLPIETPDYFLILNMATAEKIGLDIPQSILDEAFELIYQ